ncbi:hypothetical protein GGR51DRAFT_563873 [Nemania sp. FL0031]|nr:hypothetical protein GGR51DRAFT_563873 [Nemania sp. FL0031]
MTNKPNKTTKTLTKRELWDLQRYLANATAHHLSSIAWDCKRHNCHGEGRASSDGTWHIGVWRQSSNGHHFSVIVSGDDGGPEIVGSKIDHGTTQPPMIHVLNEYKRLYKIRVNTPTPPGSDPDDEDERGGKGKGRGKPWSMKIKKDNYGGYYYMGPNDDYHTCDEAGNDIGLGNYSATTGVNSIGFTQLSDHHGYAAPFGYSATGENYAASGSVEIYEDNAGRRYYIDENGNTRWV